MPLPVTLLWWFSCSWQAESSAWPSSAGVPDVGLAFAATLDRRDVTYGKNPYGPREPRKTGMGDPSLVSQRAQACERAGHLRGALNGRSWGARGSRDGWDAEGGAAAGFLVLTRGQFIGEVRAVTRAAVVLQGLEAVAAGRAGDVTRLVRVQPASQLITAGRSATE